MNNIHQLEAAATTEITQVDIESPQPNVDTESSQPIFSVFQFQVTKQDRERNMNNIHQLEAAATTEITQVDIESPQPNENTQVDTESSQPISQPIQVTKLVYQLDEAATTGITEVDIESPQPSSPRLQVTKVTYQLEEAATIGITEVDIESPQLNENTQGDTESPQPISQPFQVTKQDREQYLATNVALCRFCIIGDWRSASNLIKNHPDIVTQPITINHGIALQLAVAFSHKNFVKRLLELMHATNISLRDRTGCSAFCIACITGNIDIVRMMLQKSPDIYMLRGYQHHLPIQLAALCGHENVVHYFYQLYEEIDFSNLNDEDWGDIFLTFTSTNMFDLALMMLRRKTELATFVGKTHDSALSLMARPPRLVSNLRKGSWYQGFFRNARGKHQARDFLEQVWAPVVKLPDDEFWDLLSAPREIIFEAARNGNLQFLQVALRTYPDLVYRVDRNLQTIFHIAATRRDPDIFGLIFELGALKDCIASSIDVSGNKLLHLVAFKASNERLCLASGPALQMQQEILWFRAVEDLAPYLGIRKNRMNLTPHELFVIEHKSLREEGEKWLKETSSSCMFVAALMMTVIFATVFTVPGGSDEKTGLPKYGKENWFVVFIFSAGIGVATSLSSLLTFLSVITSRYSEDNFRTNLPVKLMFGLITLYSPILCMLVCFVSTLVMIRRNAHHYGIFIIGTCAFASALIFIFAHLKLWFITLCSANRSRHLFSRRGNKSLFHL